MMVPAASVIISVFILVKQLLLLFFCTEPQTVWQLSKTSFLDMTLDEGVYL